MPVRLPFDMLPLPGRGCGAGLFLLCLGGVLTTSTAWASRIVAGHESWSGRIVLAGDVQVPAGTTLTLQPGTELLFPPDATLVVEGRLSAKGDAGQPIVLRPAPATDRGAWQGLSIHSGGESIELEHLVIEGAAQALTVTESTVRATSVTLRNGLKGVVSGIGARLLLDRVNITDMREGGIEASVRSQVQIIDCRIERTDGFGIQAGQQASVLMRNNHIAAAKFGILANGDFPPMEGNVVERCELGIGIAQASPNAIVRGNRVTGAKTGIACQQFASPTIERNTITDCEEGLTCIQGASPLIRQNRFSSNRRALSCVQMCYPEVVRNDFVDNETAAYLHLSSYARFLENNFERNRLHIELDNMSYDWEVRAGMKPTRNRQKQSEVFMRSGRETTPAAAVDVQSEGFVNARDNYWGGETTLEMAAKGPDANISTIQDAFDVPTRTYEGWPGEYRQDRVRYDGWKAERIAGAGP